MSLRNLVIIAGIILALVFYKIANVYTAKKPSAEVRPQIDGPGLARRGAPVASSSINNKATNQASSATIFETQALAKSPGCDNKIPTLEKLSLGKRKILQMSRGQPVLVFYFDDKICVYKNSTYRLEMSVADPAFKVKVWSLDFGTARVVELRSVDAQKLATEFPGLVTSEDLTFIAKRMKMLKDSGAKRSPILVVKYALDQLRIKKDTFGAPLTHPLATVVAASAEKTDLNGYFVVDVRPQRHFSLGAIPQAVNVPLSDYFRANKFVMTPSKMIGMGTVLDLTKLPVNKAAPILVYSNSPDDFASYNAVTFLANSGFSKIFWLRGGIDEWLSKPSLAEIPSFIEKLRYETTLNRMRKSIVLDVRTTAEFARSHLRTALSTPFQVRYDDRGLPLNRGPSFSAPELNAKGEHFAQDPNLDRLKPIIIYGKNEYDSRTVKAAITLFSKGYKQIAIIEGGIDEWRFNLEVNPSEFTLVGSEIANRGKSKR